MNMKIRNFGPIKKADIDIAPLTIFVGPNSSGKSYSALLIHTLLNPFNKNSSKSQINLTMTPLEYLIENNEELYNEFNREFIDYLDSSSEFSEVSFEFPKDKFDQLIFDGIGRYYRDSVEAKLKDNFNISLNDLNNIITNESFNLKFNDICLMNDNGNLIIENFSINTIMGFDEIDRKNRKLILSISRTNGNVLISLNPVALNLTRIKNRFIPSIIYGIISEIVIHSLTDNSYYLPTSSYTIAYNLNSILSREINGEGKSSKINKELMALLLKNNNIGEGFYKDIAIEMSKEIFGGVLEFKEDYSGIKFIDLKNNVEFSFDSISSSIKELAPLIKYLADVSQINDTLIIEEPENHLHPKNQRILVKYMVKLVNNGLNIILNTHSDYMLEQFNNFIRLGEVDSKKLDDLNYSKENILNPSEIAIYNFKKDCDYQYIPELIDINKTGFIDENFSKITDELYDESVEIIDSMGGC